MIGRKARTASNVTLFACLLATAPAPAADLSLADRLVSPDRLVRENAARELTGLDPAGLAELKPVLIALLKAGNGVAVTPLVQIGPSVAPELVEVVRAGQRTPSLLAVEVLGRIGPSAPEALPAILQAIESPDPLVRMVAADALGRIGAVDGRVVPALIQAAQSETRDAMVRMRLAMALGQIGARAAASVPTLVALLGDQERLVRHGAAQALARIGPPATAAVPALIHTLADPEAYIRSAAEEALVAIGPPSVPALVTASRDPDMYVRAQAVRALADLGPVSPQVVPTLLRTIRDANQEVRDHAASGLYRLPAPDDRVKTALRRYQQSQRATSRPSPAASRAVVVSREATLASVPADADHKYPLALAETLRVTVGGREILVTLHRGTDRGDRLRIWVDTGRRYRLLETIEASEDGQLQPPIAFRHRGETFIHVMLLHQGTGHHHEDTLFWCTPDGTVQTIGFEPAPDAYRGQLGPGESVWKGEHNVLADDRMTFEFYLWKHGDANCCPSAGRVTGTYRMTGTKRYDARTKTHTADYKVEADTFNREAVEEQGGQ